MSRRCSRRILARGKLHEAVASRCSHFVGQEGEQPNEREWAGEMRGQHKVSDIYRENNLSRPRALYRPPWSRGRQFAELVSQMRSRIWHSSFSVVAGRRDKGLALINSESATSSKRVCRQIFYSREAERPELFFICMHIYCSYSVACSYSFLILLSPASARNMIPIYLLYVIHVYLFCF